MYNYNNFHIINYDIKEKKYLYIYMSIIFFWNWFISVFIPALIYWINNSIYSVFLFFALFNFFRVLFDYVLTYKIINKFWTKISLILQLIFYIIFNWFIIHIDRYNINLYLFLSSILLALSSSLRRIAFYNDFSSISWKSDSWKKIAFFNILLSIVNAITPIVWWFLIQNKNINSIFFISSIFLLLASIPIIISTSKHNRSKKSIKIKKIINIQKNIIKNKFFRLFSIKWVIDFISYSFWPLFIFILVWSYKKLWIITSITTLLILLITYYTWKLIDNKKSNTAIKYWVILQIVKWSSLLFSFSFWILSLSLIYFFDAFGKISSKLLDTTVFKDFLSNINEKNKLEKIIIYESGYHWTQLIWIIFLMFLFFIFKNIFDNNIIFFIPLVFVLLLLKIFFILYKNKNN